MRGTASIASTVMGRSARESRRSGLSAGLIKTDQGRAVGQLGDLCGRRRVDLEHDVAVPYVSFRADRGAVSVKASSVKLAFSPAPDSTNTSYPSAISCATVVVLPPPASLPRSTPQPLRHDSFGERYLFERAATTS